jgi:hypothetical protein
MNPSYITVTQSAGSYNSWNFSVPFAGIIHIGVEDPTINGTYTMANTTYNRVLWNISINGIQYDNQTFGETGIRESQYAAFPVLPTPNLEIRIGNTVSAGEVQFQLFIEYIF